ncbi:hypothetical protein Ocin01_01720 [Orchesella cincta]|uniref:oxaloacetate tautomerase n=1 Tax=Orchesella cincta TaxID=48709 RepID=A0A1D2NI73_ORCCI|nr:hypothetical protein Ocin01_01720 [Orchesella cincta]
MSGNFTRFAELGRKIVAVGRNYRDHAAELGNAVPEIPLLFLKPASSYITEGTPIKIPKGCTSLHHEIELGVVIGQKGTDIPEGSAMNHVAGYVLALDMTARDFQNIAKKKETHGTWPRDLTLLAQLYFTLEPNDIILTGTPPESVASTPVISSKVDLVTWLKLSSRSRAKLVDHKYSRN